MNIKEPKKIDDYIIHLLQKGPLKIVELIEKIKKSRPSTTKQGVYKAIRDLKKIETIVVHEKHVSLSSVWLLDWSNYISLAQHFYKTSNQSDNSFLSLGEGEKMQFTFKSFVLTDAFWSHAFQTLVEVSSPKNPVLIYNPHEWFLIAREVNETKLFEFIKNRGQQLGVAVGNQTLLDKMVRKHFDGVECMYDMLPDPLFEKTNYYVNIIGDYLIEVTLDQNISKEIDNFYNSHEVVGEKEKNELLDIVNKKSKNKFVISRNKRKTDLIKRKIAKNFPF